MNIISIKEETVVDGEGLRTSIYFAGCKHECPSCQNPTTWEPDQGEPVRNYTERIKDILRNPFIDGITLTGGDPFYDDAELLAFLLDLKDYIVEINPRLNIWVYTGYTYEEILELPYGKECLKLVDVLVDGKYNEALPPAAYRGSSNQRLIDVKQSLKLQKVILINI